MIDLDHITFVGNGLQRPECALCTSDGRVHAADWRGGVTVIEADGTQCTVLARGDGPPPKPNGIAILEDGSWLLAHLGDDDGGVYRLHPDGRLEPFLLEVAGEPLPPTNYVHVDGTGRVWITVSTRLRPRGRAYRGDVTDGFIVLVDGAGARVAADGLGFTNECLVHPETGHLYVNETFARRLTRFDVAPDGTLGNRATVAEFGPGVFPDGLTFDAEGGIWITSIVSNRVIRVTPGGELETIVDDSDPDHLAEAEAAYIAGTLGPKHLHRAAGRRLRNISSLAFGGADLRTVYLGCLAGDEIATFRSPMAGLAPAHWNFRTPLKSRPDGG